MLLPLRHCLRAPLIDATLAMFSYATPLMPPLRRRHYAAADCR
jgi:hypothetical protein